MKGLKLPSEDKAIDSLNKQLTEAEQKAQIKEEGEPETEAERQHKMMLLRKYRMKVLYAEGVRDSTELGMLTHQFKTPYELGGQEEYDSPYWVEQRAKGEALIAQRKREHQEWLAMTDAQRQVIIAQRAVLWKRNERWCMENQRGTLGPISSEPPEWWIEQYEKKKQEPRQ